jgi:thiamine biosynthesis lipoprotein
MAVLLVAVAIGGVDASRCLGGEPAMQGRTLGTTFHVRLAQPMSDPRWQQLQADILETLDGVESRLSVWREDSEISRLNQHRSAEPYSVSPDLATVLRFAVSLHRDTDGAFDPTLAPLQRLWGFRQPGRDRPITVPDSEVIAQTLRKTGAVHLECLGGQRVRKRLPDLELDLDAVASGYAVDRVAKLLDQAGSYDYLVEIGGELRVRGRNPDGVPWRIGIDRPIRSDLPKRTLYAVMSLSDTAVATSGDYRTYRRDAAGRTYGHILDPRTGAPVRNDVASVTVLADSALLADGAATALFVMGPEAGLKWAEARPGLEALFLTRRADGELEEKPSPGFLQKTALVRESPQVQ